jgi:hypothetical protein
MLPLALRTVLQTADELGVKIPTKLRTDIDSRMALIKNVAETSFAGQSVAEAVNEAVLAGKDPVDDTAVQAAFIRDRVHELQGAGALDSAAQTMLQKVVADAVDGIFDAFKPAYDKAGAQLSAAHAVFAANGLTTMDDSQIASAGIEVAQANVDARKAIDVMRRIPTSLDSLEAALGKMGNGNGVNRAAMTIDTGIAPASDLRRFQGALTPWEALGQGYSISLANPTEQRARIARAHRADEDEAAGFEQARKDAIHAAYSTVPRTNGGE